jgi:hypothetical protein
MSRVALAGAVALSLGAAAMSLEGQTMTVRPGSHDFGKETVGKTAGNPEQLFVIQLPPGAGAHDTIVIKVVDPTQEDFKVDEGPSSWHEPSPLGDASVITGSRCDSSSISNAITTSGTTGPRLARGVPNGAGSCYLRVWFRPTSPGTKKGIIVIGDVRRNTVTAIPIFGIGVGEECVYTVVQGCNYAPMYSGTFSWSKTLTSPTSSYAEDVLVNVVSGVATCNATTKSTENGNISVGTVVAGKGLIAVEFVDNATNPGTDPTKLIYRISVACPSPAFPATADAPATPSRPADLGDFSQETYEQRINAIGLDLIGTTSQPAPEADSVNKVDGRLELHWSLKRR